MSEKTALTAELAALDANKPHRRYQASIEVGADTLKALAMELRRIAQSVERSSTRGVLGGCDVGSRFEVIEDASVTNESYMAAIHEHLDRRAQLEQELADLDKPQGIERYPVVKRGGEIRCLKGCPTVDDDCDAAGHPIASGWSLGGEARQLDTAEASP